MVLFQAFCKGVYGHFFGISFNNFCPRPKCAGLDSGEQMV